MSLGHSKRELPPETMEKQTPGDSLISLTISNTVCACAEEIFHMLVEITQPIEDQRFKEHWNVPSGGVLLQTWSVMYFLEPFSTTAGDLKIEVGVAAWTGIE